LFLDPCAAFANSASAHSGFTSKVLKKTIKSQFLTGNRGIGSPTHKVSIFQQSPRTACDEAVWETRSVIFPQNIDEVAYSKISHVLKWLSAGIKKKKAISQKTDPKAWQIFYRTLSSKLNVPFPPAG
jgi:hypothetical protein